MKKIFIIFILIFSIFISDVYSEIDLSNFPYNFISQSNNVFLGKIVIGKESNKMDDISSNSLIEYLKIDFDLFKKDKVELIYGGIWESLDKIVIANGYGNFKLGMSLNDFASTPFNKSYGKNLLVDSTIDIEKKVDYTQEIFIEKNGYLQEGVTERNKVKGVLHFKQGNFITYSLELNNSIDFSNLTIKDIVGTKILILGNQFIILNGWISLPTIYARTIEKLTMIRANDILKMNKGESKIIMVEDNAYNVKVDKILSNGVDFIVNDKLYFVELYNSTYIGNVSLGLVKKDVNSVDFLLGDIEIILEDAKEIKVNGVISSDVFGNYSVVSTFKTIIGSGWKGFNLTYRIVNPNGYSLNEGNDFDDGLLNAFKINFEYSNYNDFKPYVPAYGNFVFGDVNLFLGKVGTSKKSLYINSKDVKSKSYELRNSGLKVFEVRNFSSENVVYSSKLKFLDTDIKNISNVISIGGPAVNNISARLLNLSYPTYEISSGVIEGESKIQYFKDYNSIVVYGWDGADTATAVNMLKRGNLSENMQSWK